jgi:hypothetical protein
MRLIKLFFLFFLISSDVSAIEIDKQINTIKKDFNIIYNIWNRGGLDKYESIFRRDNENAFSTCVATRCGGSLIEQYNSIVSNLQKATGEKQGIFGKQFSWEQYQNYKNIYFEQKKSTSQTIKNTNRFLNSFEKNFLIITSLCKKIDNEKMSNKEIKKKINLKSSFCNKLLVDTKKNLNLIQKEFSNFRLLLNYSLNESHNNKLKKSSQLLVSYNESVLDILDKSIKNVNLQNKEINNLIAQKKYKDQLNNQSKIFNIKLLDNIKNYKDLILDESTDDPTIDFYYEKFDKLKVSKFKYEFNVKNNNNFFNKYYLYTYKLINKKNSFEPIVGILAEGSSIFKNLETCRAAENQVLKEYSEQKNINKNQSFNVVDIKNQNYFFNLRTSCYEKIFSTKYTLVFRIEIENIQFNNYNGLLNLMNPEINTQINIKNNNKIKF